jgi:hypothetical protein
VAELLADTSRLDTMASYSRDFARANFDWDRHVATLRTLMGHGDHPPFAAASPGEVMHR